jgi:hypothetical protein
MPRRTINYCKAQYDLNLIDRNIQEVLSGGHNHLSNPSDRKFLYKDPLYVKCLDYTEHENHLLFHICAYEPGGPTLTIPDDQIETTSNVEADELSPPDGLDYLQKDLFALVCDNNILYCCSGLRFSGFRVYIRNVILGFEGDRIANSYSFSKVGDSDKIKYLREHEVKEIQFSSSLTQHETASIENDSTRNSLVVFVKEIFGGRNLDLDDINNSENIRASLSLKFDTRLRENQVLFQPFSDFAEDLVGEEDVYYNLILKNGENITSNEINRRKRVDVSKHGNSVNKHEVWQELQTAFYEFVT